MSPKRSRIRPSANFSSSTRPSHGVVVHRPDSSDSSYPLKEWDVITKIGDTPLDDQGMIKIGSNLRVYFTYLRAEIREERQIAADHRPQRQRKCRSKCQ